MAKVRMYTTMICPYCQMAKQLLKRKGVFDIEEIAVDRVAGKRDEMVALTGRRTVPQIFVGETHVGGHDDLVALDRAGELDPLLAA